MTVNKKTVQAIFGGVVAQIGYKQLFVVTFPIYQLLVSYRTIVGYHSQGAWLLTTAKYSTTTSRHLTQFARGKTMGWIEQEHLQELVRAARGN